MNNIVGIILLGASILYIIVYAINLVVLYIKARKIRTSSKGIKRLKFQTANNTWKKYMKKYTEDTKKSSY